MSIENEWRKVEEYRDDDLSSLLQSGNFRKIHSANPLQKIKRNLLYSIIWALLIAAGYIYVMIHFPQWPVVLCIGVVLLFTLWAAYTSFTQYRSIRLYITENSLLDEMQKHYNGIQNWMKTQLRVAIFVYPVAAAGGFMIGGMMGSGKSIEWFLSKPKVVIALVVTIIILVPLSIWFAKWLFSKSYGKHMKMLKKNIDSLKTV